MPSKIEASDKLKDIYNKRYSLNVDRWSYTNYSRCSRIVKKLMSSLHLHSTSSSCNKLKSLDVGCAKGCFTEAFRQQGFSAYGIDYSDVAINIAKQNYPQCNFFCMDGFNPNFKEKFDVIFIRGFSGCNTYDFEFVSNFLNKYIEILNPSGHIIVSFASDYSGESSGIETANWSLSQIEALSKKLKANYISTYYWENDLRNTLVKIVNILRLKKNKKQFYLVYKKL